MIRNPHFRPNAAEIVRAHNPSLSNLTLQGPDFRRAVDSGDVTLAGGDSQPVTIERVLEDIITAEGLVVIPRELSLKGSARYYAAYSERSLTSLSSRALSQYLEGVDDAHSSFAKRKAHDWRFSRVLPAEFERRHEQYAQIGEEALKGVFSGITWWGARNKQRRILTLYKSLQGAELKARQDAAFFAMLPSRITNLKAGRGKFKKLSTEEKDSLLADYEKYLPYVERYQNLGLSQRDLIEEASVPANYKRTQRFWVPGDKRVHEVNFSQIPVDGVIGQEWELVGECKCRDYSVGRNRRSVKDENYRCKHQEAALHSVRKLGERYGYDLEFPGVFLLEPLVQLIDKLRYDCIIDAPGGRTHLGAGEIENIVEKAVIVKGPQGLLTCDPKDASHMRKHYLQRR